MPKFCIGNDTFSCPKCLSVGAEWEVAQTAEDNIVAKIKCKNCSAVFSVKNINEEWLKLKYVGHDDLMLSVDEIIKMIEAVWGNINNG
jgi:transcription elongation factor Elf1